MACVTLRAWSPLLLVVLGGPNPDTGAIPADWKLKEHSGKALITSCGKDEDFCVHFTSRDSSFSLERAVDVNPAEMPYLSWRWKVTHLPGDGDFRSASTDDQAAQVLIAFSDRRVLTYIWDSNAPKGTMQSASSIPLVHVFAFVCESGTEDINRWIQETRNVAADYERAFGKPAPHIKGLRLQINTQHTRSYAESYFGEAAFRSTQD